MWFIIGLLFLGIETISFGLISIWFSIGAFVAMCFTDLAFLEQFYIFVGVSFISLLLIRRFAMKWIHKGYKEVDRVLGSKVTIKEIKENGNYTVYLEGKYWDCICEEKLTVGEVALANNFSGNKLVLKKIKKVS